MTANIETMAYVKRNEQDIPWHKLGIAIPEGAADVDQILAAAELDWTVEARPAHIQTPFGFTEVENAKIITRSTDNRPFGVVTDAYEMVQNREGFETVADWIADGRMQFETAGALGDGSRVWGLARIGEDFLVGGVDRIVPYVLLILGHNGKSSIVIKPCDTRVVCANTMAAALRENYTAVKIRHVKNAAQRMAQASQALGLVNQRRAALMAKFDEMAQTRLNESQVDRIFDIAIPEPPALLPGEKGPGAAKVAMIIRDRAALRQLYANSPTVDRGTAWGVFNAVTEFIDHAQNRRNQNATSKTSDWLERRALYTLEGEGEMIRNRVLAAF